MLTRSSAVAAHPQNPLIQADAHRAARVDGDGAGRPHHTLAQMMPVYAAVRAFEITT